MFACPATTLVAEAGDRAKGLDLLTPVHRGLETLMLVLAVLWGLIPAFCCRR